MSNAVLLPTIGDPLLLNLWLDSYEKIWSNEVDNAYMLMTSDVKAPIRNWITKRAEALGWQVFHEKTVGQHGDNIRKLLHLCNDNQIVLLEDDVFVLQPGQLSACFNRLQPGVVDCIGSTRLSASQGLVKRQREIFDLSGSSPEHAICDCPHLWPSLVFCSPKLLLATDQYFNSDTWDPGTYLQPLDWTTIDTETGDTFVWTSIQLRAMGCKFGYVHQYHAGPVDLQQQHSQEGLFVPGGVPWVHFGSLSTGICDMLRDENNRPLAFSTSQIGFGASRTEAAVIKGAEVELSRRVAMYYLVSKFGKLPSQFETYNQTYALAVDRTSQRMGLSPSLVNQFLTVYEQVLKPIL